MNIFLQDPDEVRLPPEEVRLLDVQLETRPNSPRVKVALELTPFKKRPNVDVTIRDATGKIAARSSILEVMMRKLEFNMHIREPQPGGEYTLESSVYYQQLPEPSDVPMEVPLPEPMVVDQRRTTFVLSTARQESG